MTASMTMFTAGSPTAIAAQNFAHLCCSACKSDSTSAVVSGVTARGGGGGGVILELQCYRVSGEIQNKGNPW